MLTEERVAQLHQLIFAKLLGEVDYGARGDFSKAGCDLLTCNFLAVNSALPSLITSFFDYFFLMRVSS